MQTRIIHSPATFRAGQIVTLPGARTVTTIDPLKMTPIIRAKVIAALKDGGGDGGYQSQAARIVNVLSDYFGLPYLKFGGWGWHWQHLHPAALASIRLQIEQFLAGHTVAAKLAQVGNGLNHEQIESMRATAAGLKPEAGSISYWFFNGPRKDCKELFADAQQLLANSARYKKIAKPLIEAFERGVTIEIEMQQRSTSRPPRKKKS
jgi:hypothetical protein